MRDSQIQLLFDYLERLLVVLAEVRDRLNEMEAPGDRP
jgi:hypothetical protein